MTLVSEVDCLVVVSAILALIAVAGRLRVRRFRDVFRMPVRRDDWLPCRGPNGALALAVRPDGFDPPDGVTLVGQTAFLALTVESTAKGRWVDPYIEVLHRGVVYRQYFERGAAGRRYVNLSPVFQDRGSEPSRVGLRGSSIRWKPEATLLLFDPLSIEGSEILVLAPHPDDAEIAAFGVYSGRSSWVVTVTAGERGTAEHPPGLSDDTTRWNAFLRVWDSLTIPQLGGVPRQRCVNLVYPDGQLQPMYAHTRRAARLACEDKLSRSALRSRNLAIEFQEASPECTWGGLVEEIRRVLERVKPQIVLSPHPLIDAHPDHVFTTVALEQAVRQVSFQKPAFLLYVVHGSSVPLYPFGSAAGWVSSPPWMDEQWLAESVYSHPLAPEVRTAKYFAVEASHDERSYLDGEPRTLKQAFAAIKREVSALLSGTGVRPTSFLRRAPRPNELFWVVSAESLSELVERALARYPTARE